MKKKDQPATMVSAASMCQPLAQTDGGPTLVSIEGGGLYQQQLVSLGNAEWVFLAAKLSGASQSNSDQITTLFLQQAQQMAAQPKSLPLNQGPTVNDVGPGSPYSALFGGYNAAAGSYIWFVIIYAPNTGQGAPGGSIAFDQNGHTFTAGSWVCWPFYDQASGLNLFLHYADNDSGGIVGAFTDNCS